MNINAAKGLYDVMKTNLGPKGTIKMLVNGAGGKLLRALMESQHPSIYKKLPELFLNFIFNFFSFNVLLFSV